MEDFLNLFKNKAVGYAILGFVIFTGLVDLKVANDPNARPDSFTGKQGAELSERIDEIEVELMEFKRFCEQRYDEVNNQIGRQDERLTSQQRQLSECIRRTQ